MKLGSARFYDWQFVKLKFNFEVKPSLYEMHRDSSYEFFSKDEIDPDIYKPISNLT